MRIDLDCDCGNPNCHATLTARKTTVFGPHGEPRPGWLHVDAIGNHGHVEIILSPAMARDLMWKLVLGFAPFLWRFRLGYK